MFFGLGFETTTPSTALSIQAGGARGADELHRVLQSHHGAAADQGALLDDPHMVLDGFVGPGHVSMVIGVHPYDFIAEDYGKPLVVSGFEPLDLLQSVLMVFEPRSATGGPRSRTNMPACRAPSMATLVSIASIEDVYEPRPSFEWRGLGRDRRERAAHPRRL